MILDLNDILRFIDSVGYTYKFVEGRVEYISGFCSLSSLVPSSITWIRDFEAADYTKINADIPLLIVTNSLGSRQPCQNHSFILTQNPKGIFFSILNNFFKDEPEFGICEDSVVKTATIGKNVFIGHHCYIHKDATIGDDVIIRNNVCIECRVEIGKGSIINSGCVIGSDGFGYFKTENGKTEKVEHFGGVKIGEDVEIGANVCIDRGTLDDTFIGNNVKIDNLCHIGHNSKIHDRCVVIALSMLGGSCVIDDGAYVAPSCSIINKAHIGANSVVGIGSVVIKDIAPNRVAVGVPAREIRENNEELFK